MSANESRNCDWRKARKAAGICNILQTKSISPDPGARNCRRKETCRRLLMGCCDLSDFVAVLAERHVPEVRVPIGGQLTRA